MKKVTWEVASFSTLRTSGKRVEIQANAPNISSDGGLLVLGRLEKRHGLAKRVSSCLVDWRRGEVDHPLAKLAAQRIFAICMGWEDCNDFGSLCDDPLYRLALGSRPASQPTLSRFENSVGATSLYRLGMELLEVFVQRHLHNPPERIVLDLDATDDPAHGQQQLEFFNPFYDCHCFLPLLVFGSCDGGPMDIIAAVLRPGNAHSGRRAGAILKRLARRLKQAFPETQILVRADAGFAQPEFYIACEELGLEYTVAIGSNEALTKKAEPLMAQARAVRDQSQNPCRLFGEFAYSAQSWKKKERRVIYKAEALEGKDNARFVVTNIERDPEALYRFYCLRGDSENRIKEMKLDMASGRTSCTSFAANAFRLMLHAFAFTLLNLVRAQLEGTALAKCALGQIRLKLLKVAAIIEESTRRFLVRLPRGHPYAYVILRPLGP